MIPASRFKRVLAFIIDGLIIGIPSYFVYATYYIQYDTFEFPQILENTMSVIGTVIAFIYFGLFESSKYQATLGKQLFKIYVSDLQDQKITFARALGRYLLLILPGLLFIFTDFNEHSFDFTTNPRASYLNLIGIVLSIVWIIPVFFTQARTTIYDMLSSTRVNKTSKQY